MGPLLRSAVRYCTRNFHSSQILRSGQPLIQPFAEFGSNENDNQKIRHSVSKFASYRHRNTLNKAQPIIFPRGFFGPYLPAFTKWFKPHPHPAGILNTDYFLSQTEHDPLLEVEVYGQDGKLSHMLIPWSLYIEHISASPATLSKTSCLLFGSESNLPKVYLAQQEPPEFLLPDIPSPFHLLGFTVNPKQTTKSKQWSPPSLSNNNKKLETHHRIDIYNSSLWLSKASSSTNTPLHTDPNDNIFLQLSGEKIVRCLPPKIGEALFREYNRAGHVAAADARGHLQMPGHDRRVLDAVIWEGEGGPLGEGAGEVLEYVKGSMVEARVGRGDGVYIPRGWWHAVRSVESSSSSDQEDIDEGQVVASVNWWFR